MLDKMNTYIAEIAGKDSIAAVHMFIRTHANSKIIPSIVYTRTEYGGFESYFHSLKYLKKFGNSYGIDFKEIHYLYNEKLWNIICVKYQYQLHEKYGFYTPCIMCHLFTHLMRIPSCYNYGTTGIITGERFFHSSKIKINQHPLTVECFKKVMDYSGIGLIQPLLDIADTNIIDKEIGDIDIILHANDTKCILSGNLHGYVIDEEMLKIFLDDYVYKIGIYIVDRFKSKKDINYEELSLFIERIF